MNAHAPLQRLRRNRIDDATRRLVREHTLTVNDLIWPIFFTEGTNEITHVEHMPGIKRVTLDKLAQHVEPAAKLNIPAIALFPVVPNEQRDPQGKQALNRDNLICRAARLLKKEFPQIALIGDVALDPYTSHGHDGIIKDGYVDNDLSVDVLSQMALIQAQAGIDILAPSDMMDGRVQAMRHILDTHDLIKTRIMSYTAKYASTFYGPFRSALGSAGVLKGDKKTYQMDPANSHEATREAELDIQEGADMLMVKPGMPYLDVLARVKETFQMPTFSYQVSGEYAMLAAAFEKGWLARRETILESLLGFKRAGGDGVLTYFAVEAARYLKEG